MMPSFLEQLRFLKVPSKLLANTFLSIKLPDHPHMANLGYKPQEWAHYSHILDPAEFAYSLITN